MDNRVFAKFLIDFNELDTRSVSADSDAHINLDLYRSMYNPYQASASNPFTSIDASINTDADTGAKVRCGQSLKILTFQQKWGLIS